MSNVIDFPNSSPRPQPTSATVILTLPDGSLECSLVVSLATLSDILALAGAK